MKISFYLSALLGLLLLSGCATSPRGAADAAALSGASAAPSLAQGTSPQLDYQQVLADPGPF